MDGIKNSMILRSDDGLGMISSKTIKDNIYIDILFDGYDDLIKIKIPKKVIKPIMESIRLEDVEEDGDGSYYDSKVNVNKKGITKDNVDSILKMVRKWMPES